MLLSLPILSNASDQQVVYLIRHAEFMLDMEDPPLTDEGRQRATAWADGFRSSGIDKIYTAERRRTVETGETISKALNIPLKVMHRREVTGLVNRLQEEHAGEVVLVVSSARTIAKRLEAMGYAERVKIRWDEYDTLFIIEPRAQGEPNISRTRLGEFDGSQRVDALGYRDGATEPATTAP